MPPRNDDKTQAMRQFYNDWMLFSDPPEHTRLRKLAARAFTPRSTATLESFVHRAVDEALDRVKGQDQIDIIADFGFPVPSRVIAHMLGVAPDRVDDFERWSHDLLAGPVTGGGPGRELRHRLPGHARPGGVLPRAHRGAPRGADRGPAEPDGAGQRGRIGAVRARADGPMRAVADRRARDDYQPDRQRHAGAAAQPRRAGPAARPAGPGRIRRWRNSCATTEPWPGSPGRRRRMSSSAAGWSRPGRWSWPSCPRPTATRPSSPTPTGWTSAAAIHRHLGFGGGPHACIGAALARMETRIAMTSLLARYPRMELAVSEPSQLASWAVRGVTSLPVAVG